MKGFGIIFFLSWLFLLKKIISAGQNYRIGVIQKVRSLETSSFWLPSPRLVRSCLFYMYLPPTYVRFSELPSPLKKSSAMLMTLILNKKSGGEKREKN